MRRGAVVETRTLPLSELGITPLDVVYGVEAGEHRRRSPASTLSEIEQQVLYHAKHKTGGFEPVATLRLQHARPGESRGRRGHAVRRARAGARHPAAAAAWRAAPIPKTSNPPERTGQGTIDLVELEARVVRAENALNAAHKALTNLIARITTTTTAEMLRTALLKLGAFGIAPAVPVSAAGESADGDRGARPGRARRC